MKTISILFSLCLIFLPNKVEARFTDWLLGGTRTIEIVLEEPIKTLDSEIDRLAVKYDVASSTARSIIYCESRMYGSAVNLNRDSNGEVWSEDRGHFQINDYFHKETMTKLGLDYYNEWDSLEYGFILLSTQGRLPWKASEACWSKI